MIISKMRREGEWKWGDHVRGGLTHLGSNNEH